MYVYIRLANVDIVNLKYNFIEFDGMIGLYIYDLTVTLQIKGFR